jgi:hypothetical protein
MRESLRKGGVIGMLPARSAESARPNAILLLQVATVVNSMREIISNVYSKYGANGAPGKKSLITRDAMIAQNFYGHYGE